MKNKIYIYSLNGTFNKINIFVRVLNVPMNANELIIRKHEK